MMLLDRALQRNIDGVLVPHHRNLATRPALPLAQTVPSDATLKAWNPMSDKPSQADPSMLQSEPFGPTHIQGSLYFDA